MRYHFHRRGVRIGREIITFQNLSSQRERIKKKIESQFSIPLHREKRFLCLKIIFFCIEEEIPFKIPRPLTCGRAGLKILLLDPGRSSGTILTP